MATRMERTEPPLIVIVGPTASGKTALAIKLAEQVGGEIICADSRTVYTGMDIGTAKPSREERARAPHWGLDLVEPSDTFSAADFKTYAENKVREIRGRGNVPLLVGGTGLYIDGVIFNYEFGEAADPVLRQKLATKSLADLYVYCEKNNIILPENSKNKRYVIRAIERKSVSAKRRMEPLVNCIVVGIATDKNELRTRIKNRSEQILKNGVVDEATILGKKYGWEIESMTGNIYPLVRRYLEGELMLDEVEEKFTTLDWRLAKRQQTWMRRNPYIEWLLLTEAEEYVSKLLANEC